ncbi:bis(5'-nucleosyl)-tetraphosphatase (symmetrical) YqeK [Culicoidibacter larvae]|uniref:bis(5'-nucleosyl)-tetraphosphatase (symmetrical) n=1 Tax=Culicoidibacter larvae TaxID=2579976 RepID=A0A5R8Q7V8_9FIRM|nr:bis(5'-nucleosyl)-tetraphosphatase (symmetrical) YqeK [Culicoidibacter larvae]TLG71553.1 HD domain-containing protein [Culicoidibacter larvae]
MNQFDMINLKNAIKAFLQEHDCEETYNHCIAVGDYAAQLAGQFAIDSEKARAAGYLHDISAIYPNNQRIAIAQQLGIELVTEEMVLPMIIHQKISKVMAERLFAVDDGEVLSAIECHTTLKGEHSKLDLVVFIADKIKWDQPGEPPYLQGLQNALNNSLEEAAYFYIDYILHNNIKVVHPWLQAGYTSLQFDLEK